MRDCVCEPHERDEHDRAKVGKDARVLMEGAAKERRRRSARAAGVESMAALRYWRISKYCVARLYVESPQS